MLRAVLIVVSVFFLAGEVEAEARRKPELIPGAPVEDQLHEHWQYTNKAGESVHAPAHSETGNVPDGATARCGDSSYSFSHSRSGACSRHGGVAEWMR
jgi:hypothetical protein